MSIQVISVLKDHFRLGFSRPLLWFDLFFLFLVVFDICRFYMQGLSIPRALRLDGLQLPSNFIWNTVLFLFLLMVILPVLIAFLRIVGWFGIFLHGRLTKSQNRILFVHCTICVVLICLLPVTYNMQKLSGWEQVGTEYQFSFNSYYFFLVIASQFPKAELAALGAVVAGAFTGLIHFTVHGKELGRPVKQYLARAALGNVPPELLPIRPLGRFEVSQAGTPARVKYVNDIYEQVLREYQKRSPNSPKAISYLDDEFKKCKQTIFDKLVQAPPDGTLSEKTKLSLGFFMGPRRAFEDALARIPRPRLIAASPFASPSLLKFLQWDALLTGDEIRPIEFRPDDHFQPWEEQESLILDKIRSIQQQESRTLVFILSEVFYASGRRVPLSAFLLRLRTTLAKSSIHVIVDGSNAVGNRCLVTVDPHWDYYVFLPHRWLMATEPCGILLSKNDAPGDRPHPPGLWEAETRKTDVQVRALAGLAGAMELIRGRGIKYFFERCEGLKKEFRRELPETVQVVGDQSGLEESFILSCCPEAGHRWRFDSASELEDELMSKSVKASVLKLDRRQPWLRVTIPYHSDAREIHRVCSFLEETIR